MKFVWVTDQNPIGVVLKELHPEPGCCDIRSKVENQSGLERCGKLYCLGKNQSVDQQEIWAFLSLHFFFFFTFSYYCIWIRGIDAAFKKLPYLYVNKNSIWIKPAFQQYFNILQAVASLWRLKMPTSSFLNAVLPFWHLLADSIILWWYSISLAWPMSHKSVQNLDTIKKPQKK